MKNRSILRKNIIHILYTIFIYEDSKMDYSLAEIMEQEEIKDAFVKERIDGVLAKKKELIDLANTYLVDWELKRLSKVDQAILLLGIYELKYTSVPSIVVINEAVELAKLYSDEKVVKMINGVLDAIYHSEEEKE